MVGRIHIIVVEPSAIIRCGIVTLLQRASLPNIDIAEMSDVSMLMSQSWSSVPDLLIVNPSQLGFFAPSQLRQEIGNDRLKIIALQSTIADQSIVQSYDEVISIYDSVDVVVQKISTIIKGSDEISGKKVLSQREQEIVVGVVKGMTNKQIADELFLSTHTVIAHRRNIANKLQIHSPSGLTIYAIVNKLVDLSDIESVLSKGRAE